MTAQIDSPRLKTVKSPANPKGKDVGRSEKKRKRHASADHELASPVKKHRSAHHSKSKRNHGPLLAQSCTVNASSFIRQTSSLYLPLPPISQKYALKGLCAEHLSPLILTYYPPFRGIIVSYDNPRLSSNPLELSIPAYAKSIDEYAASFTWLIADFIVFKPQKGKLIEGWVNLQNESNIGLLCLNFFNATIERTRLPKGWKWISRSVKPVQKRKLKQGPKSGSDESDEDSEGEEDVEKKIEEDIQGYFQDQHGRKVEGLLWFRVKNVETSRNMDGETSFLSIEGSMLDVDEV